MSLKFHKKNGTEVKNDVSIDAGLQEQSIVGYGKCPKCGKVHEGSSRTRGENSMTTCGDCKETTSSKEWPEVPMDGSKIVDIFNNEALFAIINDWTKFDSERAKGGHESSGGKGAAWKTSGDEKQDRKELKGHQVKANVDIASADEDQEKPDFGKAKFIAMAAKSGVKASGNYGAGSASGGMTLEGKHEDVDKLLKKVGFSEENGAGSGDGLHNEQVTLTHVDGKKVRGHSNGY